MTNEEIIEKIISAKKGCYLSLTKKKDLGSGITKESDLRMRVGVTYSKMGVNADKHTTSLPWGHWVKGLENLVVEHNGSYYLRLAAIDPEHLENNVDITAVHYFLENREISESEVINLIGQKKVASKPSLVYNIKFENILRIGDGR